jgi:hypothetical protein
MTQTISSTAGLKESILLLETEQSIKGQILKDQLFITYESLKPGNLLKYTLKEISSTPNLIDNIAGTAMGLVGGYLSKKIIVGTSGNIIRKLIGSLLQFGITNVVAQNSAGIKSFGLTLLQHFIHRKELNSKSLIS